MRQREGRRPCPDSENRNQANFVVPKARKGTGDPPFCPKCLAGYKLSGALMQDQRRGIFRFPDKWTLSPTAPTPSPRSNLLIRVALVPACQTSPTNQKQHPNTPNTPQSSTTKTKKNQHHKKQRKTPNAEPSKHNKRWCGRGPISLPPFFHPAE